MKYDQIKLLVRGGYQIQKLRVQMGNRIVANFKTKLGQEPGKDEETMSPESQKILSDIRASYNKIMDGLKRFPYAARFKGDAIISNFTELCLVEQYVKIEDQEIEHDLRLKNALGFVPIYTEFLEKVPGCGVKMSGVIISEIDIYKAKYSSSLWKYAGLDVVTNAPLKQAAHLYKVDGQTLDKLPDGETFTTDENVKIVRNGDTVEFVDGQGRSRIKSHLVTHNYLDSEGCEKQRLGISFNPMLKTKLVGVLGDCFLRAGKSKYTDFYYNYKTRLNNDPRHADKTKAHKHNMSIRYMVKRFLVDLYVNWRTLEGLPVADEYAVAKLGFVHQEGKERHLERKVG